MKNIKNKIIENITRQVSAIFKYDFDDLMNLLHMCREVISGSFILQCILNEYWEDSDIDFYVVDNGYSEFPILLRRLLSPTSISVIGTNGGYLDSFKTINVQRYTHKIHLNYINSYHNIDFIEFINTNFDFNICKNVFCILFDIPILSIHSIYDIYTRTTNFKSTTDYDISIEKCQKYENRGFTFKNKPDIHTST